MSRRGDHDLHLKITAAGTTSVYPDVRFRAGLIDSAGPLIAEACPADFYAVIADSQVARLYGERLRASLTAAGLTSSLFRFAAGEWNKTREVWADLSDQLFRAGIGGGGGGAVVGLGGGVTMVLAGFVATTYLGGLPVVQIPTTLTAMLGSAVAGVTALDTTAGKNLVTTSCVPRRVLIDPTLLSTLPATQLAAGLAEAFRHALALDRDYFADIVARADAAFGQDAEALERLVGRGLELRVEALGRAGVEPVQGGLLDFGGTVGRALETILGYGWLAGEALAVGMVAQAEVGVALGETEPGTAERVREALEAARLPVEPDEEVTPERFAEALELEARRSGTAPGYTLLKEVGAAAVTPNGSWAWQIPADRVAAALFSGR